MKYFLSRSTFLIPLLGFYLVTYLVEIGLPSIMTIGVRIIAMLFCLIILLNYKLTITKFHITFILFLFLYYVKFFRDLFFTNLDFGRTSLETILFAIGVTLIPAITFLYNNVKKQVYISGNYLRIGFSILTMLALLFNFNDNGRLSGNRMLNPITIGHIALSSLMANILYLFYLKKKHFIFRFLAILFSVLSFLVLLLSGSRGPILSLLACALSYFLIMKKVKLWIIISVILSLLIIVPIIINSITDSGFIFGDRMQVKYNSEDGEDEIRVLLWKEAYDIFKANPIIGKSTTTSLGYVHNFYLELLMSTGLVGLLIYLIPLYKALSNVSRHFKSENIYMKLLALLFIQYLVGSLFSGTLYSSDLYWMFFALMLSDSITINQKPFF
jgi:O-antigen ligase